MKTITNQEHYNQSKINYESIAVTGGEAHLDYYRDKHPKRFNELNQEIEKCFKCNKTYNELYGDAFCPHCLTNQ